jgi:hypothetical protein
MQESRCRYTPINGARCSKTIKTLTACAQSEPAKPPATGQRFQTLTTKSTRNHNTFKYLHKAPKPAPLFSNTYAFRRGYPTVATQSHKHAQSEAQSANSTTEPANLLACDAAKRR